MYKKTLTYTDYDGNERTEDFYFNLTEAEYLMLEAEHDGKFQQYLERLQGTQSFKEMMDVFRDLVELTYGEKSLDGKKFVKNSKILDDFKASAAYSDLFMAFATDDKEASAFISNALPWDRKGNSKPQIKGGIAAPIPDIGGNTRTESTTIPDPGGTAE